MPVGFNPPPFPTPDLMPGVGSSSASGASTDGGDAFAALLLAAAAPLTDVVETGPASRPIGPRLVARAVTPALGDDPFAIAASASTTGRDSDKNGSSESSPVEDATLAVLRLLADASTLQPTNAGAAMAVPSEVTGPTPSASDHAAQKDDTSGRTLGTATILALGTRSAADAAAAAAAAASTKTSTSGLLARADAATDAGKTAAPTLPGMLGSERLPVEPRLLSATRAEAAAATASAAKSAAASLVAEASAPAPRAVQDMSPELVAAVPAASSESSMHVQKLAIDTPFGTPHWRTEAIEKLGQLVLVRQDHAEIRISPADLGPVNVQIRYTGNEASIVIAAAHPATREALQDALPQLREALAAQGIALGQTSVQQDASAFAQPQNRPHAEAGGFATGARDGEPKQQEAIQIFRRRGDGLVDTFA